MVPLHMVGIVCFRHRRLLVQEEEKEESSASERLMQWPSRIFKWFFQKNTRQIAVQLIICHSSRYTVDRYIFYLYSGAYVNTVMPSAYACDYLCVCCCKFWSSLVLSSFLPEAESFFPYWLLFFGFHKEYIAPDISVSLFFSSKPSTLGRGSGKGWVHTRSRYISRPLLCQVILALTNWIRKDEKGGDYWLRSYCFCSTF